MSIILEPTDKTAIMGISGEGKSILFRKLVKKYLDAGCKVLIYDAEKEFNATPRYPNLKIYQPKHAGEKSRVTEFNKVCGEVFKSGNMIFAVTSIDFYTDPKKPMPLNLWKIVNWGRKERIGYIVDSRRPAEVHKGAVANCHNWLLFHCYIDNDIKWLKKFVGKKADELKTLDKYHYYHWTRKGAVLFDPIPYDEAMSLETML